MHQYIPKYIVKNDKMEARSQSKLEQMRDGHPVTQHQSIDRSFTTFSEAKHGGKGRTGADLNRSQALLLRGQLSDE